MHEYFLTVFRIILNLIFKLKALISVSNVEKSLLTPCNKLGHVHIFANFFFLRSMNYYYVPRLRILFLRNTRMYYCGLVIYRIGKAH